MGIFDSLLKDKREPLQGDKVEIKSPQHKNGVVSYFLYQEGAIYPDQLLFKSDKKNQGDHDVYFGNIDDLKKSIVRYL